MLGVDTSDLPDMFAVTGTKVLILDGDGYAYMAAATVKRLDTACNRLARSILERMFYAGCNSAIVHFTHRTSRKCNRRYLRTVLPYQGQRKGKDKPALLEPLRDEFMKRQHWPDGVTCVMNFEKEADDAMITDAYLLGDEGIIDSQDKDLQMTPYPYLRNSTGIVEPAEPHGWIAGTATRYGIKVIGHGPLFFWAQMVMGDAADNVRGLKTLNGAKCGPSAAVKLLGNVKCQHAAANLVLDAYRAIDQNPIPEGLAMWLHRSPGDDFTLYVRQLELSKENSEFITEKLNEPAYDFSIAGDSAED